MFLALKDRACVPLNEDSQNSHHGGRKHGHRDTHIVTIPVRCAPKKVPCPKCGEPGRRKRILPPRRVRTVAYKAVAHLEITCGEYQARCDCCTTFRNSPDGVLPRALYDNTVRDLVLERIIEDGMSIERPLQIAASAERQSQVVPPVGVDWAQL